MILIIGSEEEAHSKHIFDALTARNEDVEYWDTRNFPFVNRINWYPTEDINNGNFIINNKKIDFKDIKSIYWRWNYGFNVVYANKSVPNAKYVEAIINYDLTATAESIYKSLKCNWVNGIDAINMHKTKAFQLHTMAQLGIRIPKTLISNDKEEVRKFAEENNYDLIYKPVQGGGHTKALTKDDLTDERLKTLNSGAVQFQEKLDGVDIRVYVIGDKIFPAEIRAKTVDFRDDNSAEIVPVSLPENICNQCLKIMDKFKLKYTGIDIKTKSNGEYVFIEANPAPMFTFFEKKSGYPITETLCDFLINT